MGRNNKAYSKNLHQQAYDRLIGMQAFGDSKKEAVTNGTNSDKIYSYNTYQTYWKHTKYFVKWVQQVHPECTTLKKAEQYVPEWLQSRVEQIDKNGNHLSAWTIQTEAAALNKLYGIKPDDEKRFQPPQRKREDIKRSRVKTVRDRHFSTTNNAELIAFCKGTGLRREGVENVKGKDLMSRQEINAEIVRIEAIRAEKRTDAEKTMLTICRDAQAFTAPSHEYFIYTKEKGGRERLSPIIGDRSLSVSRQLHRMRRCGNTSHRMRIYTAIGQNTQRRCTRCTHAKLIRYRMIGLTRELVRHTSQKCIIAEKTRQGKSLIGEQWSCAARLWDTIALK